MNHDEIINRMMRDRNFRIHTVSRSLYWFIHYYLHEYIQHDTADFQREMIYLAEKDSDEMLVIAGFRNSAKSTILTYAYPIWAILGKQEKKFILIVSETQAQAQQHLINIRAKLEGNTRLLADLGPFKTDLDEWRRESLVLSKYGARITSVSTEQTIRGIRHLQYRPNIIICDDIQNLNSVRTKEMRDKIWNWLMGDVIPAGDTDTKVVVVGTPLHEDSVLSRLKETIEENNVKGTYRSYPLVDENKKILWPGKYPNMKAVEEEKAKHPDEIAYRREYMLELVSNRDRTIHREWIQYYDKLPSSDKLLYTATGVDLAISLKETANKTSMVSANVYRIDGELKVYILPNPINERLTFPQQVECIKTLSTVLGDGYNTKMFIEDVGYQKAIVQQLIQEGVPVIGVLVHGKNKEERLLITSSKIQNAQIVFPRKGAEVLIQQIVGLGIEKYDDLADAFSLLILQIFRERYFVPDIDFW